MAVAEQVKTSSLLSERTGLGYTVELVVLAAVLLAACGHLLIKYGLNTTVVPIGEPLARRLMSYLFAPRVDAGLAIYATGTVLWVAAVSKLDISFVYPITSLNYVVITLGGMWLFGESVSLGRWAGIALVMLGVALMHRSTERKL